MRYFRSDGRNTEGVDIPYAFSGARRNVTGGRANLDVSLEVVRAQAKLEPPLNQLQSGGGANMLPSFAEVAVYGRTLIGKVGLRPGPRRRDASATSGTDAGQFLRHRRRAEPERGSQSRAHTRRIDGRDLGPPCGPRWSSPV